MEQMTAQILRTWHAKVVAMEMAYQRMTNCNPNSGMYCLYRDEYNAAKRVCDEIDEYISNCAFTGYEEYVIRLRFQEALKIWQIAAKLKMDSGEEKSLRTIQAIQTRALAKMGLTKTGQISTAKKPKPQKKKDKGTEVYTEMVEMEESESMALDIKSDGKDYSPQEQIQQGESTPQEEPQEQGQEEEPEFYDVPRDIYGNPIEPPEAEEDYLPYDLIAEELDL